ncbi:hypothetical protein D5S18_23000 [Nocardia panacis]|uniref:DUF6545 domain-containing protein n=1 Tax=Nocardia panacis TaxID=2340916 RepID=A0A3A4KDW5_9NOCA|nr:DUF6545 domain-containing protein [Nocardia panacis]RJO72051.1 hypothetical protein D5S18_23000 [Nocardia panacis]
MTAEVPAWLMVTAIVLGTSIAAARWVLVAASFGDLLINRAMSWIALAVVIEEAGAGTSFAALTYRIFLALGVQTLANMYGIAVLFARGDPLAARVRQRRYDLAAAVGSLIVLCPGLPANSALAVPDWRALLVWAIFNLPTAAAGIWIVAACARELRATDSSRREKLASAVLLLTATTWTYAAVADGVQVLRGHPSSSPGAYWTIPSCLIYLSLVGLTAVPLVRIAVLRSGFDHTGRAVRRLRPLWRDLTASVPAIVLPAEGIRDPELRLYRMIVEIRDALHLLERYAPAEPTDYAVRIARGIRAKSLGHSPVAARTDHVDRDLSEELAYLLALARRWPRAVHAVDFRPDRLDSYIR